MKRLFAFSISLAVVLFFMVSCKKDNPSPLPPEPPQVTTPECHFTALVNGQTIEFVKDQNGYHGEDFNVGMNHPVTYDSTFIFHFKMSSNNNAESIEISHGSFVKNYLIYWGCSFEDFKFFHASNLQPDFTPNGDNGFEVKYTDSLGTVWTSVADPIIENDVIFSYLTYFPDTNGEGALVTFTCNFSCRLSKGTQIKEIQNAELKGWFRMKGVYGY